MVQPFCVFAQDDHVHLVVVPDPAELAMHLVRHPFKQLDRSNVGVELKVDAIADDGRVARHFPVLHQDRAGAVRVWPAHRAEETDIRVTAGLLRALRPIHPMLEVVLTPTGNLLIVRGESSSGESHIEDLDPLVHDLDTNAVTRQEDNLHGLTHGISLRFSVVHPESLAT